VNNSSAEANAAIRQAADLTICFIITVMMLETFVLEGYLISTGSMAPGLRGFHRLVNCPNCDFEFAFGVAFDDSTEAGGIIEPAGPRRLASCPNCSHNEIDVASIMNSQGDQLLVHRHVYDLRNPQRWETIVFRSPSNNGETFVKRLVGLPGEKIQVVAGDILIDGQRVERSWQQQLQMRIPVCDLACRPENSEWQLPWELDDGWEYRDNRIHPADSASPQDLMQPQWIHFRYWRATGGHHLTETPVSTQAATADWNRFEALDRDIPVAWSSQVHYDREREVLQCEGVLPEALQHLLLRESTNEAFQAAVYRLAARSHLAPVTDQYGYNSLISGTEFVVNDLMLEAEFAWQQVPESIHVRLPVGSQTWGIKLSFRDRTAVLISLDSDQILQTVPFKPPEPDGSGNGTLQLLVSAFDRRISVMAEGRPLFSSVPTQTFSDPSEKPVEASISPIGGRSRDPQRAQRISICQTQQNRWAVGVAGGRTQITSLKMFRDVFYTPGRARNAVTTPLQIPQESYFVLGDNSPVSSDSRSWEQPFVAHHLLLGRPFLVHLPSRPELLRLGRLSFSVRIPDRNRIRRIH